ncbi:MAG: HAMP domain-containing histidine kinase [Clostridiales bacterium]|nr:HAMP domain-containing histidine kinase [Clostridiales bacterium]
MFKNIYTKFVVTYITLAILIILLLTAFSIGFFYKQYSEEAEISSMSIASKIDEKLNLYYNNDITKKELTAWIDAMSYTSNTKIYVLNPDKTIINNMEDVSIFSNENIANDISKVIDGETIVKMGLFNRESENNIMYLGTPFIYNGEISGIILLFTPIEEFVSTIENMIYGIICIAIFITIIASIVVLVISKNISEPITNISNYARKLGKGEIVEDIEVSGKDEIAKLAVSFNEMKREIYAAESIRKEFVANVSHELRTPLTTILGFLKGMLDGIIKQDEYEKYIKIVYDEANRLKELTTDMLDLTKIEAGKVALNKVKFNLTNLLDDVCVEFNTEFENKGIELIKDYRKGLLLNGDRDKIKQVIINIISNSLKFTQKGYIKLSAKTKGRNVVIRIEDTGCGIPKEKIPYIFDKFYTANKYGSATNGAGLGLSIVQNMVKLHEGTISVESEVGHGTVITIEI